MQVNIEGLEGHIEEAVRRVLAERVEGDPWLDTKRSAAYLGISEGTLRNLVSSGKLKRHGTKGTKLRWRRSELDVFAKERRP